MAYDDGYYYGQCKIICEAETVDDNGRTVAITDGTNTWSKALSDKMAEFLVPGRARYDITLWDGELAKWTGVVECGYGDCIHIMLADGYSVIKEKDFNDFKTEVDYRISNVETRVDKVEERLVADDGTEFKFGVTPDGRPGYVVKDEGGADTVIPFNKDIEPIFISSSRSGTYTFDKDYNSIVFCYNWARMVSWSRGLNTSSTLKLYLNDVDVTNNPDNFISGKTYDYEQNYISTNLNSKFKSIKAGDVLRIENIVVVHGTSEDPQAYSDSSYTTITGVR